MPKVLRLLNRLAVGGPVLNAVYLTKYMAPEFETLLVVGEKEDHEKNADFLTKGLGIPVTTIAGMGRAINPMSDYSAYKKLKKLMLDFKPDIVHTHAAKPGIVGRLSASAVGVPVIVHTYHGHVFHSYFNSVKTKFFINIERYVGSKTDAIIAISEQQKRELAKDFAIAPEEKFRVIPLGLDLDKFRTGMEEKRAKFRSEFGVQKDEVAIGIIGRLVPVKNHALFLQGLAYVLAHTSKKVKAFIIGDGERRVDLENKATEAGIRYTTERDIVHPHPLIFTSWRKDVDVICAGLDVVTLTSFNEGTPVSLIEAQAANKPAVSTRVGGISDIVVDGKTALLSDVTDTATYCRHLLSVVQDDELRKSLGANSHQHIMQRFAYQRLVKDMSLLYNELLQQKNK